jgi:tetratricopeptide (TPR) repeat protein
MPKFSNHIIALLLLALLSACQSLPDPGTEVASEAEVSDNANEMGQRNELEPVAEIVTEIEPQAEPEPVDFAQQDYLLAIAALKNGDSAKALELLLRLSREAADKPNVFTNLGLAYFQLQQADLAEQAFAQALERNANDAIAHNHLGILKRRKGEFQDALLEYQRAIEIDTDYALAHLNLGILFDLYLQDLEKALQQYRKYMDLTSEENAQVAGWIVDIERRLKSTTRQEQG